VKVSAKTIRQIEQASESLRMARSAIGKMGLPLSKVRDIDHAITVLDQILEKANKP